MKIIRSEYLKIGHVWTQCCERDLGIIKTQDDIDEIINLWDDMGVESVEVWDTELNAILELRERNISTGDDRVEDAKWWSGLIKDAILRDKNRYYGIVWKFKSDTFHKTGLLEHATLETYNDIMYIHNKIKKINNEYYVPDFYIRQMVTDTEIIIDISDIELEGFRYTKNDNLRTRTFALYYIESNFLENLYGK